jgi:3-deoxy-manno-octulosonate cytidylyltransferase (CMP-KDO synthetase)
MTTISIAIPARLGSTRLARKLLLDLGGKPVLWHTWHRASQAKRTSEVVVLTDAKEIVDLVQSWGGRALLTPEACTCGTERIISALPQLKGDCIINVQGDEPFTPVDALNSIIDYWTAHAPAIVTPVYEITQLEDIFNENVVKVALGKNKQALYFSRAPIPYVRGKLREEWLQHAKFYGHMGIYGYARPILEAFATLPISPLEDAEKLEQLRFLENGLSIHTVQTQKLGPSIDYEQDILQARRQLRF